jgi:ribose/xylose/arabinose/galactoside ABC-type transport system permease subunit
MAELSETKANRKNIGFVDLIIKYPMIPSFVFFCILSIFFSFMSPTTRAGVNIFLSAPNLINILEATAGFSIGAFAMTLVLLVGCTDLSASGVISLCSVVFGLSLTKLGLPFFPSLLLAVTCGALCGLLNAFIIIKFNVPPFLATIAVAFVFEGLSFTLSQAKTQLLANPTLTRVFGPYGTGARLFGLPALLWWTVLFLIIMYLLISKSKFGRWAQATGGNEQAAYSSGINTKMVRTVAFVLMGVFSAFVGIIFCARLSAFSPSFGSGYGLQFIICAVLGGTSFRGDGGNVFGTLLGSLVMGVLTNGLGILGVNTYTQQMLLGIVIVMSVVFSFYVSGKK